MSTELAVVPALSLLVRLAAITHLVFLSQFPPVPEVFATQPLGLAKKLWYPSLQPETCPDLTGKAEPLGMAVRILTLASACGPVVTSCRVTGQCVGCFQASAWDGVTVGEVNCIL